MIKTNQEKTIKDLLGRGQSIEDLSKLIEDQKESLVLSINADWGAGKTTFVKLWQKYLKKKGIENIYFSAWENDFSDEPLIAILGELNLYIEQFNNKKNVKKEFEEAKKIFEEAKKIAANIIPTVIKSTANIATVGIAGEAAEKITKELLDKYQSNKGDLSKLKKSIAKVLSAINPDKPFVIFIDELDRCKPLYAIELLERIKHIFDVERLIFVLSIDKKNLAKSIQSQYGDIDTDNYLRRFIHLEYPLKNPSVNNFCEVLFKRFDCADILNSIDNRYSNNLDLNLNLNLELYLNFNLCLNLIQQLSIIFNLSLRQIEQIFTKLHIFLKTIPIETNNLHLVMVTFILLECLKSDDNQRYNDFLAKRELKIGAIVLGKFDETLGYRKSFIELIITIIPLRDNKDAIDSQIRKYARHIGALHNAYNFRDDNLDSTIKMVIKRIDFAEKFYFKNI